MPSNDDHKPSIDADWRSFIAKLVAAEKSRPKEPTSASSLVDLDSVVHHEPNPITVGDKWAHTIHESEKGCLLLATEKLSGVHIFERTTIWVLPTGPLGPSGIILNRPSLMSIKETRSTTLDVAGMFYDRPLLFGGPLEEGYEVMKGLNYGTKEGVGCAAEIVKRDMLGLGLGLGLGEFRFFYGYCRWEKGQLKNEIKVGYWTLAACSPSVIDLSVGSVGLWERVLGLMGRRKVW